MSFCPLATPLRMLRSLAKSSAARSMERPRTCQKMEYEVTDGPKGPQASKVRKAG